MKALIDPYVIVVPPLYSSADRVLSYAEGIETWVSATSYPFLKVFYPSRCVDWLIGNDRFPFWKNIVRLLADAGITQYDVQALVRLSTSVFDLWEDVEYVESNVAIDGELTVMPTLFADRLPEDVSQLFCNYLGKVALWRGAGDQELADLHIGSTDVDKTATQLAIRGTITDIRADGGDLALGPVPIQVDSELPVLLDREDILSSIDWTVIWKYPTPAIEKGYYAAVSFGDRATYGLGNYNVGSQFLDTIAGLGLHSQVGRIRSIYETCALIVCGRAAEVGGINPRRLRGAIRPTDGAEGMRADVSRRGPGYRLHYWQCRDRRIELSCVNVHSDMRIY